MDISVDPSYDCRGNTGLTETHIIVMAIGIAAIFLVIIVILLIVVIHYKRKDSKRKAPGRSPSIPNAYEDGYMTPSVTPSINGSSTGAPYMTPSINGSSSRDNSRSNFKREESHKYDIPYAVQDYTPMRSSVVPPTPIKPKLYKSRKESEGYLEPSEIGSTEDLYRVNSRKESDLSDGYTDPVELDTSNDTYSVNNRKQSDGYIHPMEMNSYRR